MSGYLKTGVYEIINHQHKNHARLADDKFIRGDTFQVEKPQDVVSKNLLWKVELLGNGKMAIRNKKSKFYTVCDQPPRENCNITATSLSLSQWDVTESGHTGYYVIMPTSNPNLFWGLRDCELGTPIILRGAGTNHANWWMFRSRNEKTSVQLSRFLEKISYVSRRSADGIHASEIFGMEKGGEGVGSRSPQ